MEQVRGEKGPKGDAGKRGPEGELPSLDLVVKRLVDSDSFSEAVSNVLTEEHSERLRGVAGPRGPQGLPGPPGPQGQPGSISLSGSEVQRVVSGLVSNKELIDAVAKSLMGPIKPLVMQVKDPESLSCGTVCNLEFGKAVCRGGLVKTILGGSQEVSCSKKVRSGEMLSCYCAPSSKSR